MHIKFKYHLVGKTCLPINWCWKRSYSCFLGWREESSLSTNEWQGEAGKRRPSACRYLLLALMTRSTQLHGCSFSSRQTFYRKLEIILSNAEEIKAKETSKLHSSRSLFPVTQTRTQIRSHTNTRTHAHKLIHTQTQITESKKEREMRQNTVLVKRTTWMMLRETYYVNSIIKR